MKLPLAETVAKNFHSPLPIDATGASDKDTIAHVSAVSTSNETILPGPAMPTSESSGTDSPSEVCLGDTEVGIISGEGSAMKGDGFSRSPVLTRVLRMALSEQMSTEITLDGTEHTNGGARIS